jgi:hypothetical protein
MVDNRHPGIGARRLTINNSRLFQLFKYTVYALLALNIYWFWREEYLAAAVQFPNGVQLANLIDAYAATIDTAAWVVLLLMFELETYVLEDHHYSPTVTWTLHGVRALCYVFIVYAFYGYFVNLAFFWQTAELAGVGDLCSLAGNGWSYAIDLDEYTEITAANCASFSDAGRYLQFDGILAVVDSDGFGAIKNLAWVDVINAGVWLLVVLLLEVDVWLQERDRLEGAALTVSNASKVVLYGTLLFAAIFWGIKGDFVDFWDAFLWLVAFVFIELNVFEWRQESLEEVAIAGESAT